MMDRDVVARGVPFDDGDSGAHFTDAAVRFPGAGVGARVRLLDGDGGGDLLLILSHVIGAGPL